MGVGVGAGLGAKSEVKEAKASTAYRSQDGFKKGDTLYIEPQAAWTGSNAKLAVAFFDSSDNTKWSGFLSTKSNDGFFKYVCPDEWGDSYTAVKLAVYRYGPDKVSPDFSDLWGSTNDITVGDSSQDLKFDKYTNCIWLQNGCDGEWKSNAGSFAYDESKYQLTVGENDPVYLTREGNTGRLSAEIEVKAGDSVTLKVDGVAASLSPESTPTNNLKAGTPVTVKVDATMTIYVEKDSEHTCWASGYADELNDTLKLFCERLLVSTINAGTCGDPTDDGSTVSYDGYPKNTWAYFKDWYTSDGFSSNRSAFSTAVSSARYGQDLSYTGLLDEAACRYATLVVKYNINGANAFAGSAPALSSVFVGFDNITSSANNSIIVIVAISVVSLLAVGGYFLLRRRKED